MSDFLARHALPVLRHTDALAAWVLLGWLGMRLDGSFASGVLPMVVWWAVRSGCEGRGSAFHMSGVAALSIGMLALGTLASGQAMVPASMLLLAAAAAWGFWSASIPSRQAQHPAHLPGLAMGLMMGSLWLSGQWCLGPGWTDSQRVALHLSLMISLPWLVAGVHRMTGTRWTLGIRQAHALVALGACLMTTTGATAWHITGMSLVVMGWSAPSHHAHPPQTTGWSIAGPALLLAVGLAAPDLGPASLQSAWALVAVVAATLALLHPWRAGRPPSYVPQSWRDAA